MSNSSLRTSKSATSKTTASAVSASTSTAAAAAVAVTQSKSVVAIASATKKLNPKNPNQEACYLASFQSDRSRSSSIYCSQ
mmetsp:Transcript_44617/g.108155  ORF Transcript_44617/g.108155 Transcript_44617/m.108155 type:complete len:81 (-) Transcript_44617:126-368(-)